ncbi:MAG: F0F1 ATP synthase subunit A, partial [Planctomycetota bacterium]|nr:F0F1 ATP synthase subunit A [Planctomycetota bacterium]
MSTALHIAHQFPALADAIPSLLASGGNPLDHVLDKPSALGEVLGIENLKLSIVSVVVSAVLAFVLLLIASRSIATGPASAGTDRYLTKGRLGQIVEVIVQGLRQGVLEPLLGKKTSDYYLPFFLSLFFFVLMMNLLGLIPFYDAQKLVMKLTGGASNSEPGEVKKVFFGGTATASLSVTAGLATISFFAILYQSMRDLGVKGFLEHMCGGKELLTGPKGLLLVVPVIFVVEVLGLFIKPGALAIRLFANILAGHTLMATIFMFTGMALAGGWIVAAPVGVVSVAFAVAIYFLELFVAFL